MGRKNKQNVNGYIRDSIYGRNQSDGQRLFMPNTSRDKQTVYERFYYRRLTELSMNRFQWNNLPVSIDRRHLEQTLLYHGLSVFFWDTRFNSFMALPGSAAGGWNATDNPRSFHVVAPQYPAITLSARDCVPIWANYTRLPELDAVQIYAQRLAAIDVSLDVNSLHARRTKVVVADENTQHTSANIQRLIDEGAPVVYLRNPLGGQVDATDFSVDPKNIESLHMYKVRLWNECMMMLGINGSNQDKRERVQTAEVEANNEQIDLNRALALNSREYAAQAINRKYADKLEKEITVEYITQAESFDPTEGM